MLAFIHNFISLILEAAPWLVVGLFLGGLIQGLFPVSILHQHLSGQGFKPVIKAALFGAPLPLCSCGVIPAALSLRKAGASKPATVAFLISTPETGIDSIAITYAMLGPAMAVIRPIAAVCSAVVAGLAVAWFDAECAAETKVAQSVKAGFTPTAVLNAMLNVPVATPNRADSLKDNMSSSCCGSTSQTQTTNSTGCKSKPSVEKQTWLQKALVGVRYAFTQLLADMLNWLLIGMLVAAAAKTFIPPEFLAHWGSGIAAILVMILISIPTYTGATASTPMATGLILAGVSPGVALVFLLTGPATNVSTLAMVRQALGQRSMLLYIVSIILCATLAGLAVDSLIAANMLNINAYLQTEQQVIPRWLEVLALLLLAGVSLRQFIPGVSKAQTATK